MDGGYACGRKRRQSAVSAGSCANTGRPLSPRRMDIGRGTAGVVQEPSSAPGAWASGTARPRTDPGTAGSWTARRSGHHAGARSRAARMPDVDVGQVPDVRQRIIQERLDRRIVPVRMDAVVARRRDASGQKGCPGQEGSSGEKGKKPACFHGASRCASARIGRTSRAFVLRGLAALPKASSRSPGDAGTSCR